MLCELGWEARELLSGAVLIEADYDVGRNNRRLARASDVRTADGMPVPPHVSLTEEEVELSRGCCPCIPCCPSPWLPALYHSHMVEALRDYLITHEGTFEKATTSGIMRHVDMDAIRRADSMQKIGEHVLP